MLSIECYNNNDCISKENDNDNISQLLDDYYFIKEINENNFFGGKENGGNEKKTNETDLEKEELDKRNEKENQNQEDVIMKTLIESPLQNSNKNVEEVPMLIIDEDEVENTKTKKHTKYDDDNLRRKCKHIVLDSIFNFINYSIRKIYNNKIGQGILRKQLKTLNQKQKSESNIQFNKEFLGKTIGEIFSDKISGRITLFPPEHNKKLINELLDEKDINKKMYFRKLFNLTFLQCLKHFRKSVFIPELCGMKLIDDKIKNYLDEPDYADNLIHYFNDYENIINNKRGRKPRKKKEKLNNDN